MSKKNRDARKFGELAKESRKTHGNVGSGSATSKSSSVDAATRGDAAEAGISVDESEEGITIKWEALHNIKEYAIRCTRSSPEKPVNERTTETQCSMKTNSYEWQTGEVINISIIATSVNGNSIPVCEDHRHVIGGDTVPYAMCLMLNEEDCSNTLILKWGVPERVPDMYQVTVFEENGERHGPFIAENSGMLLQKLKPSTKYSCAVMAKHNGIYGKPVRSNTMQTANMSSESPQVLAWVVPNSPRQIVVTWEKPKGTKVSQYEVFLTCDKKKQTEIQKIERATTEACFKYLKSETEYKACVVMKTTGLLNTNKERFSDPVKTAPVKRNHGFDIEKEGKPNIKVCLAEPNGNKLYGNFEWDFPDLGNEKYNYEMAEECVTLWKSGTQVALDIKMGQLQAKFVELEWGKNYLFVVKRCYRDCDIDIRYVAVEKETLMTDISKPKIDHVTWSGDEILVAWSPAKGANKHTLTVTDAAKISIIPPKPLRDKTFQFPICGYGKILNFSIAAYGDGERSKSAEKVVLIGGEIAVTDVVAERDTENPRRAMVIKWNPPKNSPTGYKVMLIEVASKTSLKEENVSVWPCQHRFVELKTSTEYQAQVCPTYVARGTFSIKVQTNERVKPNIESDKEFGKTNDIRHVVTSVEADQETIALSWQPVQMGENFKVLGFRAEVHQKGIIDKLVNYLTKTGFQKNVRPNQTKVEVTLQRGQKYDSKITTLYQDLDTTKKGEATKDYEIFTDPSVTIINDCKWENGIVTFSWKPVDGAQKYKLMVKDHFLKKDMVPDCTCDATPTPNARIKMSESGLQIGRACMTKVKVYAEGGGTSETDWKAHLIGGDKVPLHVKASRNFENPKRAINVTFDRPSKGAAVEYKIQAVPKHGMPKVISTQSTQTEVFEYLRKGVSYHFYVHAKWGNDWSEGSPSNSIQTDGDRAEPVMGITHTTGYTNVDLTHAILAGQKTNFNVGLGKDFGQARELRSEFEPGHDKDKMTLYWKIPSFDNKSSDYKVESYKVDVWKKLEPKGRAEAVNFERKKHEYKTRQYELNLGETYGIAVSTIYLDIDQDCIYESNAVTQTVHTRPCIPLCTYNDYKDDKLKIEWNAAKGAHRYVIELHTDRTSEPFRKETGNKTVYEKEFDETFGFGATYHAVITALGVENVANSYSTIKKTIGGDRVPTNVLVTSKHPNVTDPNTQVSVSWTAPPRPPIKYSINSIPAVASMGASFSGEECLVSGLKAGTEYYFQVKAIYGDNESGKSGGSSSNRIQTNPTPTQVKSVSVTPGENPSTSVEIFWEKVDAEKDNETTKYRVILIAEKDDETTKSQSNQTEEEINERKLYVKVERLIVKDLDPGSSYVVTVAGGNSDGYGKESEKVTFNTDLGTPKNVRLLHNEDDLSSSLVLKFSGAEGEPLKYIATLYKLINQVETLVWGPKDIESGDICNDLESNTEYLANVSAVFTAGEGKVVKSETIMTAPSTPKITECDCLDQEGQMSSKDIYAKWTSDVGCKYHEIKVKCFLTAKIETRMIVENRNECRYSCLNEAMHYSIQIRSRNASGRFGEWSHEAPVYLAPPKLERISILLEENGRDIVVQCLAAKTRAPLYFMQVFCEDKEIGDPIQTQSDGAKVKWNFPPPEHAQKYTFAVWIEDLRKVKGKITFSESVISWPSDGKLKSVKRCESFPNTDIAIEWKRQNRCDSYEVKIRVMGEEAPESIQLSTKPFCRYGCRWPGKTYLVAVRAVREVMKGKWSAERQITLAPAEVNMKEDPSEEDLPVKNVKVEWEQLETAPEGYLVKLFCDGQEVESEVTTLTHHIFEKNLTPGSLCYCTIAAYNDREHKIYGKATKSKSYRIEWLQASNFSITADDNVPSRRARMKWDRPAGVNRFKLKIENNQTGLVTTMKLANDKYLYESGIPGNTYSVRLYCGCDDRFDTEYVEEVMTMKPAPPTDVKVIANRQVKGLTVEFKDATSVRKQYEVTAQALTNLEHNIERKTSQHSLTLRDLMPGESFKVYVATAVGECTSIAATSDGYVSTLPDKVVNLRSEMEGGSILFHWDPLEIPPEKYIVEWKVNDGPVTEEHTEEPKFMISLFNPARCYNVRVTAANSSGCGPMTFWEKYITAPSPPYALDVYPDSECPETSNNQIPR